MLGGCQPAALPHFLTRLAIGLMIATERQCEPAAKPAGEPVARIAGGLRKPGIQGRAADGRARRVACLIRRAGHGGHRCLHRHRAGAVS